jgi:hypothetical protein
MPLAVRDVVRVADVAARHRGLPAEVAVLSHRISPVRRIDRAKKRGILQQTVSCAKADVLRTAESALPRGNGRVLHRPGAPLNLDGRKISCYFSLQPK